MTIGEHLIGIAQELAAGLRRRAAAADRAGALPAEDIAELQASGYLAGVVPKRFGGLGASLTACVAAQLELAKGSAATGLVIAMSVHLVGHEREVNAWPRGLRERLMAEVAAGKLINSAASEPRLGSPARGGLPDSYAEVAGDDLVIYGHKNWVTGGEHLAHLIVRVRLGGEAISVYLPNHSPGVRWQKTWGDGLSLRASDSHDVYLEGVRVPVAHSFPAAQAPSVWFPLMMAANYLGAALEARDAVIRYALARVPTALGRPIASLPAVQRQLGELEVALAAARQFLLYSAERCERARQPAEARLAQAAAAKHLAVETALSVTDKALRIAGAAAIGSELPLERCFRDVRGGLMHPPAGDAALELVGRAALKPPRG